jgi:hypothetical protein
MYRTVGEALRYFLATTSHERSLLMRRALRTPTSVKGLKKDRATPTRYMRACTADCAPLFLTMDPRPVILHYVRQGYGRQLATLCDDSLKRRGNESTTVFWKAYAAAREGKL